MQAARHHLVLLVHPLTKFVVAAALTEKPTEKVDLATQVL